MGGKDKGGRRWKWKEGEEKAGSFHQFLFYSLTIKWPRTA